MHDLYKGSKSVMMYRSTVFPLRLADGAKAMSQPTYHTDCFGNGPVKYRDVICSIGVLEAPDNHMPIGIAHCRTWDERGLAVWELTVRGENLPGRWVIVDREFRPLAEQGEVSPKLH
jgi:hypothetical protein